MATQAIYTGDGSNRTFNITFPYSSVSDIKVYVNGFSVAFSLASPSAVLTLTAPPAAARVRVARETSFEVPSVVFEDGAVLTSDDLNISDEQLFRRVQEIADALTATAASALRGAEGDLLPTLPLPADRAGKVLSFNSSGAPTLLSAQQLKGDPGSGATDVGLFSTLSSLNIPASAELLQFQDRGIFKRYRGPLNLVQDYAAGQGIWWGKDLLGQLFMVDTSRGIQLDALGASTSASVDNQNVLTQAYVLSSITGITTFIVGRGRYRHSGFFRFPDGSSLIGQGMGITILEGTGRYNSALEFRGEGITVRDLTIDYTGGGGRGPGTFESHGLSFLFAKYFNVTNVQILNVSGAIVMVYGSMYGTFHSVYGKGGQADGLHITGGHVGSTAYQAADITVTSCFMEDLGDDHFPVIGYKNDLVRPARVSFYGCHSRGTAARAFVAGGTEDVSFIGCYAINSNKAGFAVLTDGTGGGLFGNARTKIHGCTAISCGNTGTDSYGAIQIYSQNGSEATDIEVFDTNIVNSINEGIRTRSDDGSRIRNLKVRGGVIDTFFSFGIRLDNATDTSIEDVTFRYGRGHAIRVENFQGNLRVNNNSWESVGTTGTGEFEVISGTPSGVIQVRGNTGRAGLRPTGSSNPAFAIKVPVANVDAAGNISEQGLAITFGTAGTEKQLGRAATASPVGPVTGTAAALGDAATKTDLTATNAALNDLLTKLKAAGLVSG